jgi:hypothetical protein
LPDVVFVVVCRYPWCALVLVRHRRSRSRQRRRREAEVGGDLAVW